jgi:hypothetical protein
MKRSIDDYEAPGFDAQQLVPEITSVMTNLGARKAVEVEIRKDGRVLWVNVDGVCVLRCHIPITATLAVSNPSGLGSLGQSRRSANDPLPIAQRSPPDTD